MSTRPSALRRQLAKSYRSADGIQPRSIFRARARIARYKFWVVVVVLANALIGLSGCVSSRSFVEGLAVTPRHPLQDSLRYSSMNFFQQDFLYLTEMVRESHPEPYAAWSREQFNSEQYRILESLAAETSKVVFEQALVAFLSRVNDSHTGARTSWQGGQLQYPISFYWAKDTLYLASVGREEDTTLIGNRVLSFNGFSVEEVFERFSRFVTSENVYRTRRFLRSYFVYPKFHRDAGTSDSDTLVLKLQANTGAIRTYRVLPREKPELIQHAEVHPVTERINRPFTYKILKDKQVCYLQYNTMVDLRMARLLSFPMNVLAYPVAWYMGIGYFESFLEEMFEEMEEENVTVLIVDMRGNGGGSSIYGEQLLYHLEVPPGIRTFSTSIKFSRLFKEAMPGPYESFASRYAENFGGNSLPDSLVAYAAVAPKDTVEKGYFGNVTNAESDYYIEPERTVFRGKVYMLIGEQTYSSAVILATLVKDNRLFPIVGQPTGGSPSHYGEILSLKLPNSGTVCTISCKKIFRPDISRDAEKTLSPDVEIWPTFDDFRYGRDPVFEWVLEDARTTTSKAR